MKKTVRAKQQKTRSRKSHTTKKSRRGENPSAMARMLNIFHRFKAGQSPTLEEIAADLEVSVKTVQRDIDCMRDQLTLPIDYDWSKKRYFFTEHVEHFPGLEIGSADVMVLWIIGKSLEMFPGATLHGALKSTYDMYVARLDDEAKRELEDLNERFWCQPFGLELVNIAAFEVVGTGLRDLREVQFDYRKQGEREYRRRRVRGYQMRRADGRWYLVGWDHDAQDERTFFIGRMRNAKLMKRRYTIPPDFSKRYEKSLGIRRGEKEYEIKVRFTARMADILCDRFWHKSQVWEELPEGGARLTLKLDSLEEIMHHVLGWGKEATVEGPPELKQRLFETGQDYLAKYGPLQAAQSQNAQPELQPLATHHRAATVADIGWGLWETHSKKLKC